MDFKDKISEDLINLALLEDRVNEDVTTNSLKDYDNSVIAEVSAKENGVISGIGIFKRVFEKVDSNIIIEVFKDDGDTVKVGDEVLSIKGLESSILKAERTALNFIQRLSGVATLTRKYVNALQETNVILLDTRKTTPGMRYLEKKAVVDGGGNNHRLNLEDMAMIKDNHIIMAGSITKSVLKIKEKFPNKKIEVEVKNIDEFKESVKLSVDIIMLDNFKYDKLLEVLKIERGDIKIEVSGNINIDNIRKRAVKGVDYISVGALTHSYKALDLSLNIVERKR